jgi:hypothetical protein
MELARRRRNDRIRNGMINVGERPKPRLVCALTPCLVSRSKGSDLTSPSSAFCFLVGYGLWDVLEYLSATVQTRLPDGSPITLCSRTSGIGGYPEINAW